MLGVSILLFALCLLGMLNIVSGFIFLAILVGYTYLIFYLEKKKKDTLPEKQTAEIEEQIKVKLNLWQALLACLIGAALLMAGGKTLIAGAVTLAKLAGLSEAVIGVTLVAFGGSVPELVTSVVAAWHKRSDIVLGNVIGSNLFNILGILGVTTFVSSIPVEQRFLNFDLPILAMVTLALVAVMYLLPKISRGVGLLLFAGYIAYISTQFIV